MNTDDLIRIVHTNFSQVYLGGIPSLLNDNGGAFLSFICILTATEALGGFLKPHESNGQRFKSFVHDHFPAPLNEHGENLWKLRNATVHGFSPGPYKLTHHNSQAHLTVDGGQVVLNAEDFYAALVIETKKYFDALRENSALRSAFEERAKNPSTGVMVVGPLSGQP